MDYVKPADVVKTMTAVGAAKEVVDGIVVLEVPVQKPDLRVSDVSS